MRALLLAVLLLGCRDDDAPIDATGGGEDAPHLDGGSCAPELECPNGPLCGLACCPSGHACDLGTTTCTCGGGPACGPGDSCERGGPVGEDLCGTICCGASGPCPQ